MGRVSQLSLPQHPCRKLLPQKDTEIRHSRKTTRERSPLQLKREFGKVASYKINTQTPRLAKYPKIVVTGYTGG